MRPIALLLVLGGLLSGCMGNQWAPAPKASQIGELRTENKGIAILYTSLHADGCRIVNAKIARRNEAGRYTSVEDYDFNTAPGIQYVMGRFNDKNMPVEVAMPAGHYGIVGLECNNPQRKMRFFAKLTEKRDIVTGFGNIYDTPIAAFEVRAGEVVDLGMLVIGNTRSPISTGRSLTPVGSFAAAVRPIPEAVLKNFEENKPDMHNARITRLMVAPGQH